ncbi:delta-like protein [Ciona intestinalis]
MSIKLILLLCSVAIGLAVGKPTDTTSCPSRCNLSHGFCNPRHQCTCFPGWEGPECNQCSTLIGCLHGSCDRPGQCNCDVGWGGRKCDRDLQYCERHRPCRNGATCINNLLGGFKCICPTGLTGTTCQETATTTPPITPRSGGKPRCSNGGTCIRGTAELGCEACRCPTGFTGQLCEQIVRMCVMRPCANGGKCQDVIGNFRCDCAHGYRGRYCTEDINECTVLGRHACENGGTCVNRFGGYTCACSQGYYGSRCQSKIIQIQARVTTTVKPTTTTTTTTTTEATTTKSTTETPKEIVVVPNLKKPFRKNIKVTHIVRQVEVETSNGDMTFIRDVVDHQGPISAENEAQSSVTTVQALTFAFLGVAIALFIGIVIFMWIHCSKKGRNLRQRCTGESPTEETPMNENSREPSIVKTRHASYNPPQYVLEDCQPKPGYPMRSVALPSDDREPIDCLYVALPNNSTPDVATMANRVLNSPSLPAYDERY